MPTSLLQFRKDDIDNDNFDTYFLEHLAKITPEQKSRLPDDLVFKIFRGGSFAINSLTFTQKLKVLYFGFGKRLSILIEDENQGITYDQFANLNRNYSGMAKRADVVDGFRAKAAFILGTYDLVKRMEYGNYLFSSNLYKLASDYRQFLSNNTKTQKKVRETIDATRVLLKLLINYEGNKKRIAMEHGLEPAEWYALLHFYDNEGSSAEFVKERFKYSYNANQKGLRTALVSLQHKKLLDKRGSGPRYTFYYLTPQGRDLLSKILTKLVLKY